MLLSFGVESFFAFEICGGDWACFGAFQFHCLNHNGEATYTPFRQSGRCQKLDSTFYEWELGTIHEIALMGIDGDLTSAL